MTRARTIWFVAAIVFLLLVAVQLWIIASSWSGTSRDWFQLVLALVQVSLALTVTTASLNSRRSGDRVDARPEDESPMS